MDSIKVTFTIKGVAARNFRMACEQSSQKACDFAKSATMTEVRKWQKVSSGYPAQETPLIISENTQVSSTGDLEETSRASAQVDNFNLSKDKCLEETCMREFFVTFIGAINEKKFPERVSKIIKDKWSSIVESGLTAKEMADSYNDYVAECKSDDSKFCHPNSWINDKGWENQKSKEVKNVPVGNYDF